MGRRSRTPDAPVMRRGVTPPPRRKREKSPKNERRRSPSPYDPYYGKEAELKKKRVSRSPSPVRNFELAGNGKNFMCFLISLFVDRSRGRSRTPERKKKDNHKKSKSKSGKKDRRRRKSR